jgi:hypothetical protein
MSILKINGYIIVFLQTIYMPDYSVFQLFYRVFTLYGHY